jgi:hypothetical protein
MESLSLNTIELLSCWIKKKAFTGFDPYDIKGHRLVIGIIKKSGSSKFFVYLREIIFEFFGRNG